MLLQQHPNALPADAGGKAALHGFLGDQPHTPAGPALGGRAADHGHDALRLPRAERRLVPWPGLFVQRSVKPLAEIAPADVAHRLRAHSDGVGDLRRTPFLIQQTQHLRPLDHPHRRDAAPQHRRDSAPIGRF